MIYLNVPRNWALLSLPCSDAVSWGCVKFRGLIKIVLPLSWFLFESLLLSAMLQNSACANRLDVFSNQEISGLHANDYIYMTNGNLNLRANTLLGNSSLFSVFGAGQVTVEGGVIMAGESLFHGNTLANIGVNAASEAQLGFVALHDKTAVNFDNVLIKGFTDHDRYRSTEALQLNDYSRSTLTANTQVMSLSPMSDAINMFDFSTLTAKGSRIKGSQNGVRMTGSTTFNLTGGEVSGERSGIVASDNSRIKITGGTISSEGHNPDGAGPMAAVVAGGSDFITSPDGVHIDVDGASITGKGDAAAGIAAGNKGSAQTYISANNSWISGAGNGVRFFLPDNMPSDMSTEFLASHTRIHGDHDAAIKVDDAVRANILLTRGTVLESGNGNALIAGHNSHVQLHVDDSPIDGDIINNGGTVNVSLNDHARWIGTMHDVTAIDLDTGTALEISGPSQIKKMTNNGLVVLSAADSQRHTLTVEEYASNGGEIHFNSALAADDSLSDKLLITKKSAGQSSVSVSNLGGSGGQTLDGIELIHVSGESKAYFMQKGRITAGLYDYSLAHSADGSSWFLTSKNLQRDTPSEQIFRPEAGSYLANLDAARTLFLTRWRDRNGTTRYLNPVTGKTETTSLWLRQTYHHRHFSDNSGQIGTQNNTYSVLLGGDLAQLNPDNFHAGHLGLMGGYGNSHNNSHSSTTGYDSHGELQGYNVGLYGQWQNDQQRSLGVFIDSWIGYSWFRQHVEGQKIEAENSKLSGSTASVEGGYTFSIGPGSEPESFNHYFMEPSVQIIRMGVKGEGLTEHNGTQVASAGNANYQSRVSIRAFARHEDRYNTSSFPSFEPFFEVGWIHNTSSPTIRMDGESTHQAGSTNILNGLLGVKGRIGEAISLWGNIGQQVGVRDFRDTSALAGISYTF